MLGLTFWRWDLVKDAHRRLPVGNFRGWAEYSLAFLYMLSRIKKRSCERLNPFVAKNVSPFEKPLLPRPKGETAAQPLQKIIRGCTL